MHSHTVFRKDDHDHALPTERAAWRVKEFCEAYRIAPSTFWKYLKLGKIRVIRVGGRVLIPVEEARRIATEGLS